jgi:hypothetical protein
MISPLRFSSKIKLVSSAEFKNLPLAEMRANGEYAACPWTIRERVSGKPRGYTDDASICNAGGIHNGKQVVLFHLIPINENVEQFKRNVKPVLEKEIAKLAQEGAPLRAFLSGGSTNDWESTVLFNKLKDLLTKMGIPFSLLWGQHNGGPVDLYYSAKEDTWLVAAAKCWPRVDVLTMPDVESHFHSRYLAPGDTLEVDGKVYDAADIVSTETNTQAQPFRQLLRRLIWWNNSSPDGTVATGDRP